TTPGAVLVLMLHEIWGFWPRLNKNRFVQWMHRRDLRELVGIADAAFTSTASQAAHLAPAGTVELLPVGSNIRVQAPLDGEREQGTAVVFGLPLARVRALRLIQQDLRALSARGVLRKIVTIGKRTTNPDEKALLAGLRLRDSFEQTGEIPEAEVSRLLARATFGISAQDELSMTKSGTFMAYAAHGLNILSPFADSLGAEPLCWLTNPADAFHGDLRANAEHLRRWQERTASWPQIAARFAAALGLDESAPR
ncbi:MAG: hypothetical protein M3032_07405, partial [Verrucomicrobiota bacterium]|nr:hypothetical protein [Verrucomicrobiota bacterium]